VEKYFPERRYCNFHAVRRRREEGAFTAKAARKPLERSTAAPNAMPRVTAVLEQRRAVAVMLDRQSAESGCPAAGLLDPEGIAVKDSVHDTAEKPDFGLLVADMSYSRRKYMPTARSALFDITRSQPVLRRGARATSCNASCKPSGAPRRCIFCNDVPGNRWCWRDFAVSTRGSRCRAFRLIQPIGADYPMEIGSAFSCASIRRMAIRCLRPALCPPPLLRNITDVLGR